MLTEYLKNSLKYLNSNIYILNRIIVKYSGCVYKIYTTNSEREKSEYSKLQKLSLTRQTSDIHTTSTIHNPSLSYQTTLKRINANIFKRLQQQNFTLACFTPRRHGYRDGG